jgi:hypothetical protein
MEFLCGQIYAALRGFGVLNKDGETRRLFHDYRQMRQSQAMLSAQLGMTPISRMTLRASSDGAALDLAAHVTDRALDIASVRTGTPAEGASAEAVEVAADDKASENE